MKIIKILFLSLVFIPCFFLIQMIGREPAKEIPVELKQKSFTYEYGEDISKEISFYFNLIDKERIDECTLFLNELNEENKVGTYKAYLGWRDEAVVFDILIKDTKKPEIKFKKDTITIEYGEDFDVSSNIEFVKDEHDGELKYTVEGNVDTKKAGEYIVKIIAEDSSKNFEAKEFKVTVKKKTNTATNSNYKPLQNTSNSTSSTATNSNKKQHYINSGTIIGIGLYIDTYDYAPMVKEYYKAVMNGSRKIYYDENTTWAINDLTLLLDCEWEYSKKILNIESGKDPDPSMSDENGTYLLIGEEYFSDVQQTVRRLQEEHQKDKVIYRDTIVNALRGMNLYCSDKEMVNQINSWIINRLSYKITNNHNYWEIFSVNGSKGQCYHYSKLFNDMCRAVGIKATYEEGVAKGDSHAWNTVTINGKKYYFDVTWNDSYSNHTQWSWVDKATFSKTHK